MNKRSLALFWLLAVIAGGALALWLAGAKPAEAQQSEALRRQRGQKWEYCAVTWTGTRLKDGYSTTYVPTAMVCYFQGQGCQEVALNLDTGEARNLSKYYRDELAQAIARLGEEGWEMVGQGPRDFEVLGPFSEGGTIKNPFVLYFKRPKT